MATNADPPSLVLPLTGLVLASDVVDLLLQLEVLELEPLQLGSLRLQVLRQAGALLPNNHLL
jgi:hypothetical protein